MMTYSYSDDCHLIIMLASFDNGRCENRPDVMISSPDPATAFEGEEEQEQEHGLLNI